MIISLLKRERILLAVTKTLVSMLCSLTACSNYGFYNLNLTNQQDRADSSVSFRKCIIERQSCIRSHSLNLDNCRSLQRNSRPPCNGSTNDPIFCNVDVFDSIYEVATDPCIDQSTCEENFKSCLHNRGYEIKKNTPEEKLNIKDSKLEYLVHAPNVLVLPVHRGENKLLFNKKISRIITENDYRIESPYSLIITIQSNKKAQRVSVGFDDATFSNLTLSPEAFDEPYLHEFVFTSNAREPFKPEVKIFTQTPEDPETKVLKGYYRFGTVSANGITNTYNAFYECGNNFGNDVVFKEDAKKKLDDYLKRTSIKSDRLITVYIEAETLLTKEQVDAKKRLDEYNKESGFKSKEHTRLFTEADAILSKEGYNGYDAHENKVFIIKILKLSNGYNASVCK